jgi:hypothetical protein
MLFPIRSSPPSWFAGLLPDGRQALISCAASGELTLVSFDRDGNLLGVLHHELPSPKQLLEDGYRRAVFDDDYQDYVQRELGLSLEVIRVRPFCMPEEMLEVYQMPKHYEAFLKNPDSPDFSPEDRNYYPELITRWNESGQFVFVWGNDYWLNSNGEVEAS